jgi:hypothetical protein
MCSLASLSTARVTAKVVLRIAELAGVGARRRAQGPLSRTLDVPSLPAPWR